MIKYIKDNHVAVLISSGFGAGWSTWNYDYDELVFDHVIVQLVLEQDIHWKSKILSYCETKYPDGYFGGLDDLEVVWVPQGKKFRITEYDGSESIQFEEDIVWTTA